MIAPTTLMPALHDAKAIAEGLSPAARDLWTLTVLAIVGTEPQRQAFIDGYNGGTLPPRSSAIMRRQHALGLAVLAALEEQS